MAIVIRKMVEVDMPKVLALLSIWNIAPIAPTPQNPDPERTKVCIENTFLAFDGERLVGVSSYIIHSPVVAEACSVAIHPEYQRRGVATRLAHARFAEMRRQGIKVVRAEADRLGTIRWMTEKLGYKITGTNPKRHPFGAADVGRWTVMELNLDDIEP